MRTFSTFLIILIFSSSSALAGRWYVNDNSTVGDVFTSAVGSDLNNGSAAAPFATLTYALTQYSAGDTIYVDAGNYIENDVIIPADLTLRGAKFGVAAGPLAAPVTRGTNESVLNFSVSFGPSLINTTVDGFTILMGTKSLGIGARGLNSKVINNIIRAVTTPFTNQFGIATRQNGPARIHSFLIKNNIVTGPRFGIYFDGSSLYDLPSEISYNYVSGTFTAGFVVAGSRGHTYRANVAQNNITGMRISESGNIIEQNSFLNNALHGIRLAATDETFSNQILNNFFIQNGTGIALTEDVPAAQNNEAHFNSFSQNTNNITSTNSATFNAKCNYYGTITQSEIAAKISGNVDYINFLIDGTDVDPATPGFQTLEACNILPVKLLYFTGIWNDKYPNLTWRTDYELNNREFIIERSYNGRNFESAGVIAGNINSSIPVNYAFSDVSVSSSFNGVYYRLRQIDLDGAFSYSAIIYLKNKNSKNFEIYPNPTTGNINIKFNGGGKYSYKIISAYGRIVTSANLREGISSVNLKGLQSGTYFIKVTNAEGKSETGPIVVQ